ncbi:MAG TPA: hypothetical protein ENH41_01790 [Candidatus Omnitrophica bacterium]|nr:hypothetical protein [Candidatus Omnitrophota bacterium]
MFKKVFQGLILAGVLLLPCDVVFGQSIQDEMADLKARIIKLETKLAQQASASKSVHLEDMTIEDLGKHIDSHLLHRIPGYQLLEGSRMGLGTTFVFQGTHNANGDSLSKNNEDAADGSYSIDVEFEKEFDDKAKAFLHLETGDGAGVEDELKVFSNVNRDADDSDNSVSLTEAWYEHYFTILALISTFGKIDAASYIDNNEYANNESTQFLGRIFRNSPILEFPDDNAVGVRLLLQPTDLMDVGVVMMDANADWEDAFDNIFFSGQLNFKPNLFDRPGNYRFYGWLNDKDHIKWDDAAKTKEKGYGFGLSFDQELTDYIGAFARYGWQNPEVYANGSDFSLEQSWSAGIQLAGSLWGRDEDVFAVAFGQVMPSDDYKKINSFEAKSEGHLETYYNFKINDHLTLSPDVQVIWAPYGGDATNGNKTIVFGGLRTQIDF